MKHSLTLGAALAAVISLGVLDTAEASSKRKPREKCYGVSTAGQNDCANLAGTHSCAGQSKVDNDPQEWRLVLKGSCKTLGGLSSKEAKAQFNKKT